MKKSISFSALLLVVILALLTACSPTCNEHVDSDKDKKCDTCGVSIETVCTSHSDSDKDGKCDSCAADVEIHCTEHIDADNDEMCDNCGADVPAEDDNGDEVGGVEDGKTPPNIDLPLDPFV